MKNTRHKWLYIIFAVIIVISIIVIVSVRMIVSDRKSKEAAEQNIAANQNGTSEDIDLSGQNMSSDNSDISGESGNVDSSTVSDDLVQPTEDNKVTDENESSGSEKDPDDISVEKTEQNVSLDNSDINGILKDIPDFFGEPFIVLNGSIPDFTEGEKECTAAFEYYSELDSLGRCGPAFANICPELMPDEPRGDIGDVRPSGWHTVKYSDVIEDRYLYNRSHLIAYSLAGENANEKNLITGTRYMNQETMQIFELKVLDYVRSTGNHVLYRVTPFFDGDDLVAKGVQMEGWSVEDSGNICFNVFCYNIQPDIEIDYATGESKINYGYNSITDAGDDVRSQDIDIANSEDNEDGRLSEGKDEGNTKENTDTNKVIDLFADTDGKTEEGYQEGEISRSSDVNEPESYVNTVHDFVVNTNSGKIHIPTCESVGDMADKNKWEYSGTLIELFNMGYEPCGRCLKEYK